MSFLVVVTEVTVFFILIVVGIVSKRLNLISEVFVKDLTNLLLYVTIPALIINSMNFEFSREMFDNSLRLLCLGPVVYGLLFLMAIAFTRFIEATEKEIGVLRYMMIFGNVGAMGYHVVELVYGKTGVFYAAIFNLWFQLLTWTLGIYLMCRTGRKKPSYRIIANPGVLAILTGFFLFAFSIELPFPIRKSLELIGGSTTPMAMIVIGATVAGARFKELFTDKRIGISVLVKLAVAHV